MEPIPSVKLEFPSDYFEPELKPKPSLYHVVPNLTVLATTTAYGIDKITGKMNVDTELRAGLALKMMKYARELGYDVVCVDANSDSGWRQEVTNIGVKLFDEDLRNYPGGHPIGRSRRQAFDLAGNLNDRHRFMAWLEPEKYPFVLMDRMVNYKGASLPVPFSPLAMTLTPLLEDEADAIVPRRIDHLASYPPQAQMEELMSNISYMESLQDFLIKRRLAEPRGEPGGWIPTEEEAAREAINYAKKSAPYSDMQFGPKAWTKEVLDFVLKYPGFISVREWVKDKDIAVARSQTVRLPHDRWEATFMPFWYMILHGKTVRGVAVPYEHPEGQTKAEYGRPSWNAKRIDQAQCLTSGLQKLLDHYELNSLGQPSSQFVA